jgi:hypothetical protein
LPTSKERNPSLITATRKERSWKERKGLQDETSSISISSARKKKKLQLN